MHHRRDVTLPHPFFRRGRGAGIGVIPAKQRAPAGHGDDHPRDPVSVYCLVCRVEYE
jgi:hypothetical protein